MPSPSTRRESARSQSSHSPKDTSPGSSKTGRKEDSPPAKRQKFSRSRTACLQCRQRKSKCGAMPPDACPNCVEADLPCQWPTEDGRSSKARLQRYRNAPLGLRDVKAEAAGPSNATNPQDILGEGWLDRLLASGAAGFAAPAATGDFQQFASPMGVSPQRFTLPPGTAFSNILQQGVMPSTALNPAVDPAQFVWAVSSRLPTVEEASPNDERSVASDPSPATVADPSRRRSKDKTVKVSWWRPHGQTAIAPGLKKITLKVRVHTPQDTWKGSPAVTVCGVGDTPQELIATDGLPSTGLMLHLLDVFITHFGCQFPFIDRRDLETKIEARTGSVFLLLSIAAIAARFSTHPAIALPDLQPYEYGNVFYARAKALLGSMLGVPSRETVAAFVLLAHMGFAADSECEVWMMTGLAVRMAIDCGLHVTPPEDSTMSTEDRRLNRLVFWSVLLMDYALSFGVGRQTAFRPDDITQTLPTEEDLQADRSPFPYAAKMMLAYGPLINSLNRGKGDRDAHAACASAIREYNRLPGDMQWNVGNLQRHARNNHGSIFLHLHLWMHTIIASGYLTGSSLLRRPTVVDTRPSGTATPTPASSLWRNSTRTIGDILVLSDIINPHAYFALPFVNQAFFVAGCCYVKEIEQQTAARAGSQVGSRTASRASSPLSPKVITEDNIQPEAPRGVDLSRALLTSVATTNISTLQQGLEKLSKYWYGAEWIAGTLRQRIEGIHDHDVDLVSVRENFDSYTSLPDAGLVRSKAGEEEARYSPTKELGDLDFLSLPFDLVDGGANVVETEVPIDQVFPSNWVR